MSNKPLMALYNRPLWQTMQVTKLATVLTPFNFLLTRQEVEMPLLKNLKEPSISWIKIWIDSSHRDSLSRTTMPTNKTSNTWNLTKKIRNSVKQTRVYIMPVCKSSLFRRISLTFALKILISTILVALCLRNLNCPEEMGKQMGLWLVTEILVIIWIGHNARNLNRTPATRLVIEC